MKITKSRLKQIIKEELKSALSESTVVAHGLHAWTEDYKTVTAELDGKQISIVQIFDDLNEGHPEWQGWKSNVPPEGWDNFISEQVGLGIEEWSEMKGHRYEQPDFY